MAEAHETPLALLLCLQGIAATQAAAQVNVTQVQPNVDAGLSLSNALKQSVSSGRLGSAISSAVGYDVSVSSDTDNQMYILAQTALTQAQASAGITSKCSSTMDTMILSLPVCTLQQSSRQAFKQAVSMKPCIGSVSN